MPGDISSRPTAAGPGGAATVTSLRAGIAILAVIGIVGAATVAGTLATSLFDTWTGLGSPRAFMPGEYDRLVTTRLAVFLFVFQVVATGLGVIVARVLAAANAHQPPIRGNSFVSLAPPLGGSRTIVTSATVLMVMAAAYAVVIFTYDPLAIVHDVAPFANLMKTESWWLVALAAVIGAPIAEEIVFRGVLFGVLASSPLGPIVAAIVSSAMWASLHMNYSIYGLLAIFLIGLFLARLRVSSGSLLAPMVCHGVYNAGVIVALMAVPELALAR